MKLCAVTILEGTAPSIRFTFRDDSGGLADPSEVTVRLMSPSGGVVEYVSPHTTITNVSLGVWEFSLPSVPTPGTWQVYGAGTAGLFAAATATFAVKASPVPAP